MDRNGFLNFYNPISGIKSPVSSIQYSETRALRALGETKAVFLSPAAPENAELAEKDEIPKNIQPDSCKFFISGPSLRPLRPLRETKAVFLSPAAPENAELTETDKIPRAKDPFLQVFFLAFSAHSAASAREFLYSAFRNGI
jgi:hypothetical protein